MLRASAPRSEGLVGVSTVFVRLPSFDESARALIKVRVVQ
jgi:hypothetical protein